jgi:hypothetical protein
LVFCGACNVESEVVAQFMKPGIPGHDKAKVWLDDEQRCYRLS